jgi:hypothetical protein
MAQSTTTDDSVTTDPDRARKSGAQPATVTTGDIARRA